MNSLTIEALKSFTDYIEQSSIKARTLKINRTVADLNKFLKKRSPGFRRIFFGFWQTQGHRITQREISTMIETGAVPLSIETKLEQGVKVFDRLTLRPAYRGLIAETGQATMNLIGSAVGQSLSFDSVGSRVIEWINSRSLDMAARMTADQMGSIRSVLNTAVNEGWGTVKAGRFIRESVNITPKQYDRFVDPYRKNLIDAKVPIDRVDKLVMKRMNKLRRLRGDTIARTELNRAYNSGNLESVRQGMDAGIVKQAWKIWRTSLDDRVRDEHLAMEGERVPINESFSNGSDYPDDVNERCIIEEILEV